MQLNLGSILQGSADPRPDHVAVRHGERALRYAELDRAARGVATALRARGIAPGESVAILVPNLPEFTIAYFGILYAGCTVVPLNVLLAALPMPAMTARFTRICSSRLPKSDGWA